ncbi:MAG: hypothetical protein ACOYO0_04585 [Sandarakinorhabdus sp.]|jgi:hypothetical protein
MTALKIARTALFVSMVGYGSALILGATGLIDAGIAMLAGIVFTVAIALSAAWCMVTHLLSAFGLLKRPG